MLMKTAAIVAVAGLLGCSAMAQSNTGQSRPDARAAGGASGGAAGASGGGRDVGLTIYSSADPAGFDPQQFIAQQRMGYNPQAAWQVPGFGVVRDIRTLDLKQGGNLVSFTDVAEFIDPTTVSLVDLSVPAAAQGSAGLRVLQQKFAFDLVSPEKLLDSYIDRQITVNSVVPMGDGKVESVTGTLLSTNQGRLVLQTDKGIRVLSNTGDVQLGELPGGLITRPTLQWEVMAPAAGARKVRTAYQTAGLTWRADYNLILNEDDTRADLGAWVTVLNLSGTSYPNAELKLIAGDVQRITPQYNRPMPAVARSAMMDMAKAEGFEEKSFFEYHMYTLPRRVDIDQNATQQLVLFPTVRDVKVQKVLVYYGLPQQARYWVFPEPATDRNLGGQANKKLDVYIQFDNRQNNQLGIPLPKGKVRAYKLDASPNPAQPGALEFIGEDLIDHTARDQKVLVKLGQSFDVTGDRVQSDFAIDTRGKQITETIRVTLKNAKDQPQQVVVRESLYRWTNWTLLSQSDAHEKIDARTIHFNVNVPANGEKTVTYTVRYSW